MDTDSSLQTCQGRVDPNPWAQSCAYKCCEHGSRFDVTRVGMRQMNEYNIMIYCMYFSVFSPWYLWCGTFHVQIHVSASKDVKRSKIRTTHALAEGRYRSHSAVAFSPFLPPVTGMVRAT